nr:hypothetical protein [uncultured Chryseobacterium sp.]
MQRNLVKNKTIINQIKYFVKFILIHIFIADNFSAQTNLNAERKIDSLFSQYNSKTAGVAVGIVKDGKLIFKKGYGTANLEYNIPITD